MQDNIWYTAEPVQKRVRKGEFIKFLDDYPRKLERDVWAACEPPLVTYNDFELAERWPYSVVATTHLYSNNPLNYMYAREEDRVYSIVENYEELFNSKTGRTLKDEE